MLKSLLRFSLVLIGFSIATSLILELIWQFLGVDLNTGFTPFLPLMFAAMNEGRIYVQEFGEPPTKSEMWVAARYMTLVYLALAGLIGAILFMYFPDELARVADVPKTFLALLGIALYVVIFLSCRFFIGLGVRSALNATKRRRR